MKQQALAGPEVGGGRQGMERKGMFSFTRKENDPQTGREKQHRTGQKGKKVIHLAPNPNTGFQWLGNISSFI